MTRRYPKTLALLCALLLLPAGVLAQSAPAAADAAHTIHIAAGDLLDLTVFDTPEFSGKYRVNEAGVILVPILGPVTVGGLTADQAAGTVEKQFRAMDVLKYPHASVFIVEYATQGVTVSGEVKNPGVYPLLGQHSLTDVISAAGGLGLSAGRAVSVTHKDDPTHPSILLLDRSGNSPLVDIRPGDTVAVSRSGVVYIVGEVGKAGGYLIDGNERLTALQAVALAQGPNKSASQNKARIIRKTANGRIEFQLPLHDILYGKAVDPVLEDGDIVYVPSSRAKFIGGKATDAAIAVTSGLIIYGKL